MAGKINLQKSLQKPYERRLFISEVLNPVFQNRLKVLTSPINETPDLTENEARLIKTVLRYGNITLDDETNITCYEITLHNALRLEQNKISIQHYVRKLIIAGEAMLVNFITDNAIWRFSLVASDTKMMNTGEIKDLKTNAKRYTYLLAKTETCLTAATQLAILEGKPYIERKDLVDAFSVEKVSKPFFDEYTKIHYKRFNDFLINSNFKISVFNGDEKAIRDFVKKLLGRIVFLYFVQKKGWLGNNPDFMMSLFKTSGGNDAFYPVWLSKLFFDTLNAPRKDDSFEMPDKTVVKIPFLNGGLFEKDKHDESILTFPPLMFHNPENPDIDRDRGFLDFLNAYNFTVYEDSPDDHTVAVDPEMLGHIFENLLEDNKDKGAFYTPKEIVHYMCQESLIEYLCTLENSSPIGKIEMGKTQTDMFGNESRKGQLSLETPVQDTLIIPVGDTDFKNSVENLIKNQEVSTGLSKQHLTYLNVRLDAVRICDPAIGSGAFPMGLLHEIFNAKVLIMNALSGISPTPAERVEIKLHIIQNSIYGVDIEKGAVDIARLRFWLSLIVDEQTPKALPNLDYKIVVGNSLVSKFEDEVIAIDWEVKEGTQTGLFGNTNVEKRQDLLKEVSKKQHDFFIPENHDKKAIALKIKNLKIDLLINQLDLMIKDKHQTDEPKVTSYKTKALFMKAQELYFQTLGWQQNIQKLKRIQENPTATLHFFDWKLDFPEVLNPTLVGNNGGFDIVIGNPPYVGEKGNRDTFRPILLSSLGKRFYKGQMDLFYYFYHNAIDLLKKDGISSFITTNYFITADSAIKLRSDFKERTSFIKLINFNDLKIFDTALGQHNLITIFKKNPNGNDTEILISKDKSSFNLKNVVEFLNKNSINADYFNIKRDKLFEGEASYIRFGNTSENKVILSIFDKIVFDTTMLENICYVNAGIGVTVSKISSKYIEKFSNSDFNKGEGVFVVNDKEAFGLESTILKKFVKNSNISKYSYEPSIDRLIYLTRNDDIDTYPNIKKHLLRYKQILDDQIIEYEEEFPWYALNRPRTIEVFEDLDKIILPYRSPLNTFAYSNEAIYGSRDVLFIRKINIETNIKYILALLNSKLIYYWLYNKGKRKGEILELYQRPISEIPIKQLSNESQKPFELLVNQILTKKKEGKDTSNLEAEIDRLVYKLYNLTEAEIAVIEGK